MTSKVRLNNSAKCIFNQLKILMRIFAIGQECHFLSWRREKKKTPGIVCSIMLTVTHLKKKNKNKTNQQF